MVTRTQIPQNLVIDNGTVLENFNDTENWFSGANATIAQDVVIYKEGTSGVKAEAVTAGSIYRLDKETLHNFNNDDNFTFCFYVHDISEFASLSIYLTSKPWDKWFVFDYAASSIKQGWNYLQLNKSQLKNNNKDDFNNTIIKIRFAVTPITGKTCPITFGAIYKNKKTIPKVLLTFDDGYATVLSNAYPYMEARGIKGTCYVISDTVQGSGINYMRKSGLDTLYDAGWDIANHTKTHADLTTLSAEEQLLEITTCRDYLLNCGYTRSVNHLSYPVGKYNSTTIAQATSAGVLTARTTVFSFQSMPCEDLLAISIAGSAISMKLTCQYIYEAIKNGQTVFIMLHNIGSSGTNLTSVADFQYLVDFLYQLNVDFLTVSEWYESLTNPRKQTIGI